jgi:alanine or glycine:cation symporter, AGCS family
MPQGFDQTLDYYVSPITDQVSAVIFYSVNIVGVEFPLIVMWLLSAGLIFTWYFRFINIRLFKHALDIVRGKYDKPNEPGEVSHFQALATALSGTVGLGNIAGVAVAIQTGGPGATFWMILAGFLGMSTKFVECTLGVKYRLIGANNEVFGGPMYYLNAGLRKTFIGKGSAFLAFFFSVMCIGGALGGGNLFQSNQAAAQLIHVTGAADSYFYDKAWLIGLAFAILCAVVIFGGMKRIAKVTDKLVPVMCGIYLLAGMVILAFHYDMIPATFYKIGVEAFSWQSATGGFLGAMVAGLRRASFSNESGIGSSPIAHAAVKTDKPITEGLVSLLEPFVDTVIICTMTALIVVITGVYTQEAHDGVALTSASFASVLPWFPYVLSVAVILFAFSTMISWSYYGLRAWNYLFGLGERSSQLYKLIFCGFTVMGASMNMNSVIGFSDAMLFAMAIPNIIGLYLLAPEVKKDLAEYCKEVLGE